MRSFLTMAIMALMTICAQAQTELAGPYYKDTTLTKANSPYVVHGNIIVFQDVTMTIEPGVVIKFNVGKIELRGKLIAKGTALEPIIFTSLNPTPQKYDWQGIKPMGNANCGIEMEYCTVSYAGNALDLDFAYYGPYTFKNCIFTDNAKVTKDFGTATAIFDSCRFENNVYTTEFADVSNSVFVNNSQGAQDGNYRKCIFTGGDIGLSTHIHRTVDSCEIFGNKIGFITVAGAGTVGTNNVIYGNEIGVKLIAFFNDPGIIFKKNKICKNTAYNLYYTYPNNADLSDNCWCSTDSVDIMKLIRDGYDDPSAGIVSLGILDSCTVPNLPVTIHPAISKNTSIRVYPNPMINNATLELGLPAGNYHISITDLSGKVQKTFNNVPPGKIDLSRDDLASGLYFLRVDDGRDYKGLLKLAVQ